MSLHVQKAKEEMRRLMAERKKKDIKPTKIDNPLAKYNNAGQLMCLLCLTNVRSESVWQVHVNSKLHRGNVEQAKKLKEVTNNFTAVNKHKRLSPPKDAPPEKKIKGILKNSSAPVPIIVQKPKNAAPSVITFHNEEIKRAPLNPVIASTSKTVTIAVAAEPSTAEEEESDKTQPAAEQPIPEGFFDDPILDAKREEERSGALNDIKNLMVYKPAGEVSSTLRDVGISKIVQCVNVKDGSHVDLTCEVLRICFEKFNVGDVIKNFTGHVMYLIRHEKSCVRRIAVDEVYKAVTTDPALLPVPQYIDVFVAVAQLVTDEDVGVANKAIQITSNLPDEAYPKVLEEMQIALECNSSSRCNAFEVVINISSKSVELFKICTDLGYVDHMVSELETQDVLYQLNILELLSRLAAKPHGINYLVKHGALHKIAVLIEALKTNPLGGLLTPGYMKFFGCIAHYYPKEIFEKYPVLLDSLFEAFDTGDQTILPIALDTLGYIGTTTEGKLSLAALGSRYIQIIEKLAEIIKNSTTDIRVRALHCFASLLSVENDPSIPSAGPVDHRVTLMTREWFRSLSTQPSSMEILYNFCKNPFPDIRLAAFRLLDAVCQHQWGEELVATTAGFIEYLLDRSVDHIKDSKESKYDIIKRLSRSAAFDASIVLRLQTYVEQGPFYSETMLEVAIEDGD